MGLRKKQKSGKPVNDKGYATMLNWLWTFSRDENKHYGEFLITDDRNPNYLVLAKSVDSFDDVAGFKDELESHLNQYGYSQESIVFDTQGHGINNAGLDVLVLEEERALKQEGCIKLIGLDETTTNRLRIMKYDKFLTHPEEFLIPKKPKKANYQPA